jgi:hypothetical protein
MQCSICGWAEWQLSGMVACAEQHPTASRVPSFPPPACNHAWQHGFCVLPCGAGHLVISRGSPAPRTFCLQPRDNLHQHAAGASTLCKHAIHSRATCSLRVLSAVQRCPGKWMVSIRGGSVPSAGGDRASRHKFRLGAA